MARRRAHGPGDSQAVPPAPPGPPGTTASGDKVLDTTYAPSPMLGELDPAQLETIRASMYEDDLHSSFTTLIRQTSPGQAGRATASDGARRDTKLGTIEGVFLPTVQNILGVILFLRLPYITGQAGTYEASLIVAISVGSSVLTCISLSALVTNGKIAEGGPYYLLSRNLGPAAGGAIGILFYLGTVVASSMYLLGAIEVIQTGFLSTKEDAHDPFPFETQMSAILLALGLSAIVYFGVDYVKHSAFFFLAVVLMSLLLLILGVILFATRQHFGDLHEDDVVFFDNLEPHYVEDPETGIVPDFFFLLSVFYPSVTDPLQGANLSGVLRNPSKSIPSGTLWALAFTSLVYFVIVWLFGSVVSNEVLTSDKLVAASLAWPVAECVEIGILLSTVGAALQSLTSAPRLLAAIAYDRTVPFLNAYVDLTCAPGENPRPAVILTAVLVCLPCLAGNLDFIVPFITELFLLMYASINASCFLLAIMGGPSWRPSFKYFHWSLALLGTFYCLSLMIVISWYAGIAVIFLAVLLVTYIKTQDAKRNWGDAIQGLRFSLARDQLLALEDRSAVHAKNWRPQLLLVLDDSYLMDPRQLDLLDFAGQLKEGRGLLMISSFFASQSHMLDSQVATRKSRGLRAVLVDRNIEGFARAIVADDLGSATRACLDLMGIGNLRPNAMLIGWPSRVAALSHAERAAYTESLRASLHANKTLLVLKNEALSASDADGNAAKRAATIDIWWVVHDGGVMLLIPHLLKLHEKWRSCRLRLFTVISASDEAVHEVEDRTRTYLERVRIPAEVIPVFFKGTGGDVYGRPEAVDDDEAALTVKEKIFQSLKLPSTMTVAIRGSSAGQVRVSPRKTLQSLFRGPHLGATRSASSGSGSASSGMRPASRAASLGHASPKTDAGTGDHGRDYSDPLGNSPGASGHPSTSQAATPLVLGRGTRKSPPSRAGASGDPVLEPGFADDAKATAGDGSHEEKEMHRAFSDDVAMPTASVPLRLHVSNDSGPADAVKGPRGGKGTTPTGAGPQHGVWNMSEERLQMARFMNEQMVAYSLESRLVVTNLPMKLSDEPDEVLGYVDRMTRNLHYVLLVRGSGSEVITAYG